MDAMKSLSIKLKIEQRVIFTGYRTDIPALLEIMDIYCLTSLWEGLPIGLLEAMAAGKSVIATNVNGSKEIISNSENGLLINKGDFNDLSDKILYLYNNREDSDRLRKNAKTTVEQNYSISTMVNRIEGLYTNISNIDGHDLK